MDNNICLELCIVKDLLATSRPAKPVDAVIVYSRGLQDPNANERGDDEELLETAVSFVPDFASLVVINGSNGASKRDQNIRAWPGADDYCRRFMHLGIMNIITSMPATDTRDEAVKFTDLIVSHEWKRVIVVNQQHYLLRAMLGALSELYKRNLHDSVKLFPVAPTSLHWQRKVFGTQGSSPTPRINQCEPELRKVLEYPVLYPENFVPIRMLIDHLIRLNDE